MQTPEVLSFREFRAGLSANFRRVQEGGAVYVGPHRKPEAVLMSVAHYEDLVEISRQRAAAAEAMADTLGSLRADGLEPSALGIAAMQAVATGALTGDEAAAALVEFYRR